MQGLTRTQLEAILDIGLVRSCALTAQNFRTAIALVGKQRMADVLHVGTNLMRASRFQATLDERGIAIALQHAVVGDGALAHVASGREDGHTLTVTRVTADVAFNKPRVFREVAPDQCLIAAVGVVVEELGTQLRLGIGCLGHHEQTAGIFVDTVYQSDARVVGVVAWQVAQMPGNGVDQRAVEIAHARVYHQSGRLVDDHQLIVLVNHIKRNVLRFNLGVIVGTVEHQGDDVAGTYLIVALDSLAVDLDETGIGSLLDTVARGVLQVLRHVFVDAYRLLPTVHFHAQMLIKDIVQFFCHLLFTLHSSLFTLHSSSTGGSVTSTNSSTSSEGALYTGSTYSTSSISPMLPLPTNSVSG